MTRREDEGKPSGTHGLAAAERDRPLRRRLLVIAADAAGPFLRKALVRVTAAQAQVSLDDEIVWLLSLLDDETRGRQASPGQLTEPIVLTDKDARTEYLSRLRGLREELEQELAHGGSLSDEQALDEQARHLAAEFASVFWSGLLTGMRRAAAGGGMVGSDILVAALHVDGASDAWRSQTTLVEAAADFGLGARDLEGCGAQILQATLDDDEVDSLGMRDRVLLHFPMGLRVDRRELRDALSDVHRRHQFDDRPVVTPEEIARADAVPRG